MTHSGSKPWLLAAVRWWFLWASSTLSPPPFRTPTTLPVLSLLLQVFCFCPFFTSSMHYNFDSMPNRLHDAICFKMRSKSIFQLNCYGPIGLPDTSWRDDLIRPGAVFSISYLGPTSYPDQWSSANTGSSAILLKNGASVWCKRDAWKDSIVYCGCVTLGGVDFV